MAGTVKLVFVVLGIGLSATPLYAMINIVIDTNIFLKNLNLDNAAFLAIKNLAQNNLLSIHIPFIVENEYLTHRIDGLSKEYDTLISSIKRIKKVKLPLDISNKLESYLKELKKTKDDSITFAKNDFSEWMLDARVIKHEIKAKHTEHVWKSYFEGLAPFPLKKSRKDIPDAFIYEVVKELSKKEKEVRFICEDGNLKTAVIALSNILVYPSLESFIESEDCQLLVKEQRLYDLFENLINEFKGNTDSIEKSLNNELPNYLPGEIIKDDSIRDDNNEATIDMVYDADEININYEETIYYGDGVVVIPFQLNIEVNAYYFIFKSDYYCLDDEESKHISVSDHNEHFFMAEKDFCLDVVGNIKLSLDIKALNEGIDISEIINYDSVDIDSIDSIKISKSV